MEDQDRISLGWQPWLTPRQTTMIYRALIGKAVRKEDEAHMPKLVEWFANEAQARRELTGER